MQLNDLIGLVLGPQTISLTTTGPWTAELIIELPDLRDAPRNVWGDWGPMYTVTIPRDRPIRMQQRALPSEQTTRGTLDLETLHIESPMHTNTRGETPLVMKLPLHDRNVELQVYYDTQGQITRAELAPLRIRQRVPVLVNMHTGIQSRVA